MSEISKKTGRPLRKGSDLDAAREAILKGCSMYETARLAGISMYTYSRLRKELRQSHSNLMTAACAGDGSEQCQCAYIKTPAVVGRSDGDPAGT